MKKNLFTQIREAILGGNSLEQKSALALPSGYHAYLQTTGKPVWTNRNYKKFADEAYIRNVIAHQSIKKVATAAASVKLKITKDGQQLLDTHPLVKLLKCPNPSACGSELFEEIYSYKMIAGNTYLLAIGPEKGAPLELHTLRPDRVSIIAGQNGLAAGYRYKLDGNKHKDYALDRVLHLKYFNPLDDWYGLSPVEAAAYSIDQHNQAGEWNQALLQNGARPSGALVVRQDDGSAGGHLSEDQYNRVKSQIDEQFTGASNSGRPLLLEGGLEWKEMSMAPKDMDFINMKHSAARDIALAFGVPPQLLGIPGDNTYSNLAEARLALWEQTVLPQVEQFIEAINNWLVPMFDSGIKVEANLDEVPALLLRREKLWERVDMADFLSKDEKREMVGIKNKD